MRQLAAKISSTRVNLFCIRLFLQLFSLVLCIISSYNRKLKLILIIQIKQNGQIYLIAQKELYQLMIMDERNVLQCARKVQSDRFSAVMYKLRI